MAIRESLSASGDFSPILRAMAIDSSKRLSAATTLFARPIVQGLMGINKVTGKDQFFGLAQADDLGQQLRAGGGDGQADIGLRKPEFSIFGNDSDVTAHRKLATASQGISRNRCNQWLCQSQDDTLYFLKPLCFFNPVFKTFPGGGLFQIFPGTKRPSRSRLG
jgi:hypothetical protein